MFFGQLKLLESQAKIFRVSFCHWEWCEERVQLDKRIVLIDESWFYLWANDVWRRVRRGRGVRRQTQFWVEGKAAHSRGVIVWSAISYASRPSLVVLERNVNAQDYILHFFSLYHKLKNLIFQQDIARFHTAAVTTNCLRDFQLTSSLARKVFCLIMYVTW